MKSQSNEAPGSSGTIKASRIDGRVEVFMDGEKIADSTQVVELLESGHDPVYYFSRDDIINAELEKSETQTFCPGKGVADYYILKHGPARWSDIAWAYNQPIEPVKDIEGLVAFFPEKVELIRVTKNLH